MSIKKYLFNVIIFEDYNKKIIGIGKKYLLN